MKKLGLILVIIMSVFVCKSDDGMQSRVPQNYSILSLGDSYTIVHRVYETCRFPE